MFKARTCVPRVAVVAICLFSSAFLYGQTASDSSSTVVDQNSVSQITQNRSCSVLALQTANQLTLKQRGCYFTRQLTSPQFFVSSAIFAAFQQYRNVPKMRYETWGMFPRRVEVFYARHSARDAGELLVGYLHHEDPRMHSSGVGGFWHRTGTALLSVVTSPGDDGQLRPAFAPMAGALSSAAVGTVMYRHNEAAPTMFMHAGAVYGFYFVRAIFAEFKPDIAALALKIWH